MASNTTEMLLHCTGCLEELNLQSKTLSCLHSLCRSCLGRAVERGTDGNGQCPECQEPFTLDQLSLSPFLAKYLRRRQLESTDWKCDLCSEDGIESTAINWCYDCQQLHCANCGKVHKKLQNKFNQKHNTRDLEGIEKDELIKIMMATMCYTHQKAIDLYCERCNVCLCDTCYKNHSDDSPGCSSPSLSVGAEALKQKSQGSTLTDEMDDLKMSLSRLNERTRNYTDELNSDCDSKCKQLWADLEEMMENARQKTKDLCEDLRQKTNEQLKRWRHLLEENEKILKQLEIWRLNVCHLLSESPQDVDVVCGLRLLRSKLSSGFQKSFGPEEKCQLAITSSDWWLQIMEKLRGVEIGLVSSTREILPAQKCVLDNQWNLRESNSNIYAIYVSEEDAHVFIPCSNNKSITEFTDRGDFLCECKLIEYIPFDMCSISTDIFMVACGNENKLIVLERKKNPFSLEIKNVIKTENRYYSVCQLNNSIFVSDGFLQVDSVTEEGEKIKTIKTGLDSWTGYLPRIHADPSSGNFWRADLLSSVIVCFDSKEKEIRSENTGEVITDFCVNQFGHLYFCGKEGIMCPPSKKIYTFKKPSEHHPTIFVLKNKMFVCLRIDGKSLIKTFKIIY